MKFKKIIRMLSISFICVSIHNIDAMQEQPAHEYDCAGLKKEFPTLQSNSEELDIALEHLLSTDFHAKNTNPLRRKLIARLICAGANPNLMTHREECEWLEGTNIYFADVYYTCPLLYAVESDDAKLVSFLLSNKAHTYTSWSMKFAPYNKSWKRSPNHSYTYHGPSVISKIRSIKVAQAFEPYVDISKDIEQAEPGYIKREIDKLIANERQ